MFSVVGTVGDALGSPADIDADTFVSKIIWTRLHSEDSLICNLSYDGGSGVPREGERQLGVPYRLDFQSFGLAISGTHLGPYNLSMPVNRWNTQRQCQSSKRIIARMWMMR